MRSSTIKFGLLSIAAAAATVACTFLVPDEQPVVEGRLVEFPHAIHYSDEVGLDCVDCHDTAEDEDQAGMPTLGLCWSCHDESTEAEKPPERQLASFVLPGSEEATWSAVTTPSVPSHFSHLSHVERGTDCLECHAAAESADRVGWDWKVGMSECIQCHDGSGTPAPVEDCQACHDGIDTTIPPASHDGDWVSLHGALSFGGLECQDQPSRDCSLCHQRSQCDSCHAQTKPQTHTEAWRRRGHGMAAQLDRDRCATCHTESSCDSCHRVEEPSNHGVTWGGPTSAHCIGCHLPLNGDDTCTACHKGTPSHNLAPLRPGPPHPGPGSDCLSCHLPLEHIDNGQDCTWCHR